ncbi:MAG: bifunctional serine/threonine-protein kinase/formylglycine-generating enzyme family protein [Polyangiales bacterium]
MALEHGALFAGRFRIVGPLGAGGNGEVYEVEDDEFGGRRCALKVLVGHRQRDAKSRERFERESKLAAAVESDYIVKVFARGVADDGTPWLLMERLEGQTLEAHVAERGPLSVVDAHRLVLELGHALTAAHGRGVLHLDLKPANLFLARAKRVGAGVELKVLDFGLALSIQAGRTNAQMTTQAGTYAWMPPEQHNPRAALRKTADVWPLGLIAFWMLTGRSYWRAMAGGDEAVDGMALMLEIAQGATAIASERAAELGAPGRLPEGFDAWFTRCLATEEARRWKDGAEATRELEALLARASSVPPVGAVPSPPPAPAPPAVRVQETREGAPVAPPVGLTAPVQVLFPAKAPPAPIVEAKPAGGPRPSGIAWRRVGPAGGVALALVAVAVVASKRTPDARPTPTRDAAAAEVRDAAITPPTPPPPPPRVTEGCVALAGGTFTMGAPAGEGSDDERPQHAVTVGPFCIDRTEVTVRAYRACVDAGGCEAPTAHGTTAGQWQVFCNWGNAGAEDHPVNCVTQPQAERFCAWRYRDRAGGGHLPTEDEWEFAARGTAGRKYPWGDAPEPSPQNSNLCGSECVAYARTLGHTFTGISGWTDAWGGTAPVADLPRAGDTPEGLIGMAGNVWEWTRTPWGRYTTRGNGATEYVGVDRTLRVDRGGGWGDGDPSFARAAHRNRGDSTFRFGDVGFRCVAEGR